MPCATIHLVIADRLLDAWSREPRVAPFAAEKRELRTAFLHGSLAPDMGFIPGVDRLVSELAHYVRPARLTHALFETAETAVDRAFAWGWVAHVLGDVDIHPIVGRAVGERLYDDRNRRVDAAEDSETHVAVEVGLDMAFLSRYPRVSRPPVAYHFDTSRVGPFAWALERTYEIGWSTRRLIRWHERAVSLTRWWPGALRILARGRARTSGVSVPRIRGRLTGGALSAAARLSPAKSATRGFFRPELPAAWMEREVGAAIDAFPARFRRIVAQGVESLPELNLETGGPAGAGLGHPASDLAARKLGLLRRSPAIA